jgi:hypothetical protein
MNTSEKIANIIQRYGKQIETDYTIYESSHDRSNEVPTNLTIETSYEYLNSVWLIVKRYSHTEKVIHPSWIDYDGYEYLETTYYEHFYEYDSHFKLI